MKPVTRVNWMLTLSLTLTQLNPAKVIAAEISTSDAPSLELLEFLGLMVESEGELIGPETLGEAEAVERDETDEWISRDSPYSQRDADNAPVRRWSEDNLFKQETVDE